MDRGQALKKLGLSAGASPEEIKRTIRELSRKYHPDSHPGASASQRDALERDFKAVQEAKEILEGKGGSDPPDRGEAGMDFLSTLRSIRTANGGTVPDPNEFTPVMPLQPEPAKAPPRKPRSDRRAYQRAGSLTPEPARGQQIKSKIQEAIERADEKTLPYLKIFKQMWTSALIGDPKESWLADSKKLADMDYPQKRKVLVLEAFSNVTFSTVESMIDVVRAMCEAGKDEEEDDGFEEKALCVQSFGFFNCEELARRYTKLKELDADTRGLVVVYAKFIKSSYTIGGMGEFDSVIEAMKEIANASKDAELFDKQVGILFQFGLILPPKKLPQRIAKLATLHLGQLEGLSEVAGKIKKSRNGILDQELETLVESMPDIMPQNGSMKRLRDTLDRVGEAFSIPIHLLRERCRMLDQADPPVRKGMRNFSDFAQRSQIAIFDQDEFRAVFDVVGREFGEGKEASERRFARICFVIRDFGLFPLRGFERSYPILAALPTRNIEEMGDWSKWIKSRGIVFREYRDFEAVGVPIAKVLDGSRPVDLSRQLRNILAETAMHGADGSAALGTQIARLADEDDDALAATRKATQALRERKIFLSGTEWLEPLLGALGGTREQSTQRTALSKAFGFTNLEEFLGWHTWISSLEPRQIEGLELLKGLLERNNLTQNRSALTHEEMRAITAHAAALAKRDEPGLPRLKRALNSLDILGIGDPRSLGERMMSVSEMNPATLQALEDFTFYLQRVGISFAGADFEAVKNAMTDSMPDLSGKKMEKMRKIVLIGRNLGIAFSEFARTYELMRHLDEIDIADLTNASVVCLRSGVKADGLADLEAMVAKVKERPTLEDEESHEGQVAKNKRPSISAASTPRAGSGMIQGGKTLARPVRKDESPLVRRARATTIIKHTFSVLDIHRADTGSQPALIERLATKKCDLGDMKALFELLFRSPLRELSATRGYEFMELVHDRAIESGIPIVAAKGLLQILMREAVKEDDPASIAAALSALFRGIDELHLEPLLAMDRFNKFFSMKSAQEDPSWSPTMRDAFMRLHPQNRSRGKAEALQRDFARDAIIVVNGFLGKREGMPALI